MIGSSALPDAAITGGTTFHDGPEDRAPSEPTGTRSDRLPRIPAGGGRPMTITSMRSRLRKIDARRFEADPALKALTNGELADALRAASDDPADHALADWFETGAEGSLPPGALDSLDPVH
ncbi:hypothetical protein Q8W71_28960 [Methylobacterium sp. NEAU 140]|uniref:hypothetical protein n=1 Tax=Methylobacterium sp. NEAU 140 TaxID=3064945 RepID=UPI002733C1EA|nr:hypothetical protein [Methylobacterium sp. NEAU 140]MDP4026642.1 hypothetical protein [Methylobacterium sp. NEAU 140]